MGNKTIRGSNKGKFLGPQDHKYLSEAKERASMQPFPHNSPHPWDSPAMIQAVPWAQLAKRHSSINIELTDLQGQKKYKSNKSSREISAKQSIIKH